MACDSVVMITGRTPNDGPATELRRMAEQWADAGLSSVRAIGDAWAPSTIASAVWWGHRYGRELLEQPEAIFFHREQ